MQPDVSRWLAALSLLLLPLGACAPSAASPAPAAPSEPRSSGASAPVAAAPTPAQAALPTTQTAPLNPPVTVRMGVLGISAEGGAFIAAEEGIVPEFTTVDF